MSTTATAVLDTTSDWKASLPAEIRDDASLKDIKDIGGLAKSHINAQKMLGSSLRVPASDAKPEDWEGFYTKLGRPDKPEAYEITRPGLPDNMEYDQDFEKMLRTTAHGAGLMNQQVQRIVDGYSKFAVERVMASQKQMETEAETAKTTLKTQWGGSYDRNLSLALNAIERFGGKDLKEELNKSGLANSPLLAKAFATIGEKLLEDGMVTGATVNMQDEKSALEKEKTELYKGPLASKIQGRDFNEAMKRLTSINTRLSQIEGE